MKTSDEIFPGDLLVSAVVGHKVRDEDDHTQAALDLACMQLLTSLKFRFVSAALRTRKLNTTERQIAMADEVDNFLDVELSDLVSDMKLATINAEGDDKLKDRLEQIKVQVRAVLGDESYVVPVLLWRFIENIVVRHGKEGLIGAAALAELML